MKPILKKRDIYTSLLCLVSMIPGAVFYNKLDDKIPIHFNAAGQVDDFASKNFVIFVIPVIMMLAQMLLCIVSNMDKRAENSPKPNLFVRLIIPIMSIVLESAIVLYSLGTIGDILNIMLVFLSVMLIVIGNYMPKCKQNNVIGIKIPQTLENEEVWNKTHRLAGFIWAILGVICLPFSIAGYFIMVTVIYSIAVVIPIIYAAAISKNEK